MDKNAHSSGGFDQGQVGTLSALADMMIPEAGAMPSAASAEILAPALVRLGAQKEMVISGLETLETLSRERGGAFVGLDDTARVRVIEALKAQRPDFIGVFQTAVVTTYYQDDRVLEGVGLEARPPHPDGYEVAPLDMSLLETQQTRQPFYRVPK